MQGSDSIKHFDPDYQGPFIGLDISETGEPLRSEGGWKSLINTIISIWERIKSAFSFSSTREEPITGTRSGSDHGGLSNEQLTNARNTLSSTPYPTGSDTITSIIEPVYGGY